MLTPDKYEYELNRWKITVWSNAENRFSQDIAMPWFNDIAPAKTAEYGTEFFERFGSTGVMFQLLNCWYRFRTAKDPDVLIDTMRDTLGYTVILGIVMRVQPEILIGVLSPVSHPTDMQEHVIRWHFGQHQINPAEATLVLEECWMAMMGMWRMAKEVLDGASTLDRRHS